jgi:galactose-1-phosphate uridylyltransferase
VESLDFKSITRKSKFHNPLKDFLEDVHTIEFRWDPLLGTISIINRNLTGKAQVLFGETDHDLIEQVAEESRANCFMCPEKVTQYTPKYAANFIHSGRITKGDATLFPNLFPLSEFHAVCALTKDHYLELKNFSQDFLIDGLQACLEFIRQATNKADSTMNYATINCNYLFPAGASVVHPHIQVLGGDIPYTFLDRLLKESYNYFQKYSSNYWKDLVIKEKEMNERYIGRTGTVEWITSFSPIGTNEIQGIVLNKSNFLELTDNDIISLVDGLSKILHYYGEEGWSTFNFTLYSGPLTEVEWFSCNLRIVSRPNVYKNYRADDYFLQKLLGTEILVTSPELLAKELCNKINEEEEI